MIRPWSSLIARKCAWCASRPLVSAIGTVPVADAGDLRKFLHREHLVKEDVIRRHVVDRILPGRQHAADLIFPVGPRVLAPEVVGPEKAALQQILPEIHDFLFVEVDAARLGHHQDRAVKHFGLTEVQQKTFRFAVLVHADRRPRELRQPDREIFVSARKIHVPARAVAVGSVPEHQTAELIAAVEIFELRVLERSPVEALSSAASAELCGTRRREQQDGGQCDGDGAPRHCL